MKKIVGSALIFTMIITFVTSCVKVEPASEESQVNETKIEKADMDLKDNFFNYINGEKLKNCPIKYGEGYAGDAFDQDLIVDRIYLMIDDINSDSRYVKGSEEDIVKTAYDYYVDYDFEDSSVPDDIVSMMDEISNANSMDELMAADSRLCKDFGMTGLLNEQADYDLFDSGRRSLLFGQYTEMLGAEFKELTDDYAPLCDVRDKATDYSLVVADKDEAESRGLKTAYFVYDMFLGTNIEIIDSSNPYGYAKSYTLEDLEDNFKGFDVKKYLLSVGYDEAYLDRFVIEDSEQFSYLGQVLTNDKLDEIKTWELCRFIDKYIGFIAPSHEELQIYNTIKYESLDIQAKDIIINSMTDMVDPLYVERYYDEKTDEYIRSMCDDIKDGYRVLISDADWLSEDTRDLLLVKLENIVYVTGIDLQRVDPDEYKDIYGDNWYELYRNYLVKKNKESVDKLALKPDRTKPGIPMVMVNACYNPSVNNITINTGILNSPFFDINEDYYTNLGGIGMVIAHEMGHAFDNHGLLFDMNGNYNPSWMKEEDINTLEARNREAISYFEDNFTVFGVYHVDGEQTLGENYADLGGMECIVSLTNAKEDREKLFTSYAKIWCLKKTANRLWNQLETDEHSPEILRVNSILSTIDEFYETYGIAEGDGMYIAPEKRISRWH